MGRQGAYVTDLLRDSRGRFWAATEGNGLWMSQPSAPDGWKGFDAQNSGIADSAIYTVAEDRQGRIWAGTLNHGVSVWNGKTWKNYGVLDAPLGERIFDIAVSPLDGSVWIASSRGVARYNPQSRTWSSYSREQGLPSDQVQALAFDKQGTLYLATPCDGLAIGRAKDNYQVWRHVTADKPYPTPPGSQASGYGLPSNQLNDVLVARNGSVFVATLNGLAKSSDGGATWTYVRGRDYSAKVQQRSRTSAAAIPVAASDTPVLSIPVPSADDAPLAEDNVTRLAQDGAGRLWLGHRWQVPYEMWDEAGSRRLYSGDQDNWRGNTSPTAIPNQSVQDRSINDYATSFLLLPNGQVAVGRYGGGLTMTGWRPPEDSARDSSSDSTGFEGQGASSARPVSRPRSKPYASGSTEFPAVAAPPTRNELQAALVNLSVRDTESSTRSRALAFGQLTNLSVRVAENPEAKTIRMKSAALKNGGVQATAVPTPNTFSTIASQATNPADVSSSPRKASSPKASSPKARPVRAMIPLIRQSAVFVGEDWQTQGDWVGRYGSRYTMLCAMQSPMNHEVVADTRYRVQGELGPRAMPGDALRNWVHWERADANPNVLYNPVIGYRREAEWDDHSEAVLSTTDMGDVWARITVPEGTHKITAYFYNPNGEEWSQRYRDYLLELRAGAPTTLAAERQPPLAWTRVRDFRAGGVYKSFLVQGPGDYWLRVARNYSFNTILQAVFVDKVSGPKSLYDDLSSPYLSREYADPPQSGAAALKTQPLKTESLKAESLKTATLEAAVRLWNALEQRQGDLKSAPGQWRLRMLCYRAAAASGAEANLLGNWRWKLALWTPQDRSDFQKRMQAAYNKLIADNPELKTGQR